MKLSHRRVCRSLPWVLLLAGLFGQGALAHSRGLYKSKAAAEQRARELGCRDIHTNQGLWMPCGGEAELHRKLRQE